MLKTYLFPLIRIMVKYRQLEMLVFFVNKGETLGIVGESGCGKLLRKDFVKLMEPTEGKIIFNGEDITDLTEKELKTFRQDAQIIFQDPYASLNPRMVVSDIIAEPMDIQKSYKTQKEG